MNCIEAVCNHLNVNNTIIILWQDCRFLCPIVLLLPLKFVSLIKSMHLSTHTFILKSLRYIRTFQ